MFFVNPSKERSFSDAGNSGKYRKTQGFPRSGTRKHRKTRGFHGLARPKAAFRKGWRAKTRVLTRLAAENPVKTHGFSRSGRVFGRFPYRHALFRAPETRENARKRVVFRDGARENIVKRVVFTDLRVQNLRFGRVGAPKLAF